MNKKFILYIVAAMILAGCKSNVAEITGTLIKPAAGSYIFLEELRSEEIKRVDSVLVSPEGNFAFVREVKTATFYLLKINENNFLTMMLDPGDNIKMSAHFDSLSYPVSLTGSRSTELMVEYNFTLMNSIKKFSTLNGIYMENINNPDRKSVV